MGTLDRRNQNMRVRILDVDPNQVAATPQSGEKLRALIEPALARGEEVELDFEGVRFYSPLFFFSSVGLLIERDPTNRVAGLLRYSNLSERGQMDLGSAIDFAIRRRDNPGMAAGYGAAAEKMAERE
jgi:hypothetical protein